MDRKQFLSKGASDPDLEVLLKDAKEATEETLQEQRISFAFGNAMDNAEITKESVRQASKRIRLSV